MWRAPHIQAHQSPTTHTIVDTKDAAVWENELAKLAKKFKVAEKLMWHIRVQVYCRRGSWLLLGKLAAEKKSPIGYKPFAVGCVRYRTPRMIAR